MNRNHTEFKKNYLDNEPYFSCIPYLKEYHLHTLIKNN